MSLPRFDVLQPKSINEACELIRRHSAEGVAVLAGGTDVLVDIRRPVIPAHLPRCKGCDPLTGLPRKPTENPPAYLIALSRIPDLRGIVGCKSGEIAIGPMTTITEISRSDLVRKRLTALAEGCDHLGSPLVRNRGTIGGNICNARPAADALLPSLALGAKLELRSTRGFRTVTVEDFVTGPGETVREADEILTRIVFPCYGDRTGSSCIKLANRKALEIAVVNVASVLTLNEKGNITEVRIALGSVAPTPILAKKTAEFLRGKKPTEANISRAGEIAATECRPITDHRGSQIYRVDMVPVLVRRALTRALEAIYKVA